MKKLLFYVLIFLYILCPVVSAASPMLTGCPVFPDDNIWNTPVDNLPVDGGSDIYVSTIGAETGLHPDFGSGTWEGAPIGIPWVEVDGLQPKVPVAFDYTDESDPGPYPIPPDALIEGGPDSDGDRHILIVDRDNCLLYELYSCFPLPDGSWNAGSGAIFDLNSNALRPDGWTSADAAGLPILPGLVRYDEVASGEIKHALRFTTPQTRRDYVWPARHYASSLTDAKYPPMGQRFRLKSDFDMSGFSADVRVILTALKKYGMILADNGSRWFISGAPDERWDNDILRELKQVVGADFEAVDVSSLLVDPNSGETNGRTVLADFGSDIISTETPFSDWRTVLMHPEFSHFVQPDAAPSHWGIAPVSDIPEDEHAYFGIKGDTPFAFKRGQRIIATFFNQSASRKSLKARVSFTDPDSPDIGESGSAWYTLYNNSDEYMYGVPAQSLAEYEFYVTDETMIHHVNSSPTQGDHVLVNISLEDNNSDFVLTRIEVAGDADVTAPSIPGNVIASPFATTAECGSNLIKLTWDASVDMPEDTSGNRGDIATGIAKYLIYRNGELYDEMLQDAIDKIGEGPHYIDLNVAPDTGYVYTITALDDAPFGMYPHRSHPDTRRGNESAHSAGYPFEHRPGTPP
jgi:hypothetical protein